MRKLVASLTTPFLWAVLVSLLVSTVITLFYEPGEAVLGFTTYALAMTPFHILAGALGMPIFVCVWIALAEYLLGGKAASDISAGQYVEERTAALSTLRRPGNIALIVVLILGACAAGALEVARNI